jgi:hypothetical protein
MCCNDLLEYSLPGQPASENRVFIPAQAASRFPDQVLFDSLDLFAQESERVAEPNSGQGRRPAFTLIDRAFGDGPPLGQLGNGDEPVIPPPVCFC